MIVNTLEGITRVGILHCDRPWLKNELERSHNISLLFECQLLVGYQVINKDVNEHTEGYLKWFDKYLMTCFKYIKIYMEIFLKGIWEK